MNSSNTGIPQPSKLKNLKWKSMNVTVLVPKPRIIQKKTIGMPKNKNVGRLKKPMTKIVDTMAHLLIVYDGSPARILYTFTFSNVVCDCLYFSSRNSRWNTTEFVCTIHSATMYKSNEQSAISMLFENVRVPKIMTTNELPNANKRIS